MASHTDRPFASMSNVIEMTTYTLTGAFVTFFIARQIMKAIVFRKVALDDFFILLATALAIGLSVTTVLLTSKGFGTLNFLSVERANMIMKGYYACELLYISSLCFSKLSIVVLLYNMVVLRTHRIFVLSFGILIFTWSLGSAAAITFQCSLPRPWEMMTLRCFNKQIFWAVFCTIDTSTELLFIMLTVDLVAHLKVRVPRKIAVVACFAPRLLVVAAAVIRAVYLYQVTPHGHPAYDLWITAICTQVHICISICTACVPFMVPFFKSLQSSVWRLHATRSWATTSRPSGQPQNRLRKREAKIRFESPRSRTSQIKGPERISTISPRLPTPGPISPFLNPLASTLQLLPTTAHGPQSRGARTPSVTRTVHSSDSDEVSDSLSLQTALCSVTSPVERPQQGYLAIAAGRNTPQPLAYLARIRSPSPDPSSSSSCYFSRSSTATKLGTNHRDSSISQGIAADVFPHQEPQGHSLSSEQAWKSRFMTADGDLNRIVSWRTMPSTAVHHDFGDFTYPTRSATLPSHPKFSTTPHLHALSSTRIPTASQILS